MLLLKRTIALIVILVLLFAFTPSKEVEERVLAQWGQLDHIPDTYMNNHSKYDMFSGHELSTLYHCTYAAIQDFYKKGTEEALLTNYLKPEVESPLHLTAIDYENHPLLRKLSYLEEYLVWVGTEEKIDLLENEMQVCRKLLQKSITEDYGIDGSTTTKNWLVRIEKYEKHQKRLQKMSDALAKHLGIKETFKHPKLNVILNSLKDVPLTAKSIDFDPYGKFDISQSSIEQLSFQLNSLNDYTKLKGLLIDMGVHDDKVIERQLDAVKHYLSDAEVIRKNLEVVDHELQLLDDEIHELKMDYERGELNWNDVALLEQNFFYFKLQHIDLELFEALNLVEGLEIMVLGEESN